MMNKERYLKAMLESFIDLIEAFGRFSINTIKTIVSLYSLLFPYICLFVGQYCYEFRGKFAVGGEIFLPALFFLLIEYSKRFLNKIGKGESIPVPASRFTEVNEDGEVTMEKERLSELMVYVSDLEDWMENKGIL